MVCWPGGLAAPAGAERLGRMLSGSTAGPAPADPGPGLAERSLRKDKGGARLGVSGETAGLSAMELAWWGSVMGVGGGEGESSPSLCSWEQETAVTRFTQLAWAGGASVRKGMKLLLLFCHSDLRLQLRISSGGRDAGLFLTSGEFCGLQVSVLALRCLSRLQHQKIRQILIPRRPCTSTRGRIKVGMHISLVVQ